jgi:hypothetical protein
MKSELEFPACASFSFRRSQPLFAGLATKDQRVHVAVRCLLFLGCLSCSEPRLYFPPLEPADSAVSADPTPVLEKVPTRSLPDSSVQDVSSSPSSTLDTSIVDSPLDSGLSGPASGLSADARTASSPDAVHAGSGEAGMPTMPGQPAPVVPPAEEPPSPLPSCPAGTTRCSVDMTCLTADKPCGESCAAGRHLCANTRTCRRDDDVTACGTDCTACRAPKDSTALCVKGECTFECRGGLQKLDDRCVECTAASHCKKRGTGWDASCTNNRCVDVCARDYGQCDGECLILPDGFTLETENPSPAAGVRVPFCEALKRQIPPGTPNGKANRWECTAQERLWRQFYRSFFDRVPGTADYVLVGLYVFYECLDDGTGVQRAVMDARFNTPGR